MKTSRGIDLLAIKKANISLVRHADKIMVAAFLISFIVCLAVGYAYTSVNSMQGTSIALFLPVPFVVAGILSCALRKRWIYLALVTASAVAMYFSGVHNLLILVLVNIFIGIIGVVAIVTIEQRFIFYRVVSSVEYLNIKDKRTFWDNVVAFAFNITGDLDTRNLNIDYNMRRASIPWNEVMSTLKLSIFVGMFIWIYLSMNPTWMTFESFSSVPVYLFSLILYIPVVIMPFSIFMSMNVRIETKYKDFRLYDGIRDTLKTMAVPIFAAFMFIFLAVNENGIQDVFYFIAISVFFIIFINAACCIMYYRYFEFEIIEDIVTKWQEFRPISMMVSITDKTKYRKKEPATPKRDLTQFDALELKD